MASIPANELAQEILDACLRYGTWPARPLDALIERALDDEDEFRARAATRALFGIVVERLADLFEPSLCDVYARLFSHVISRALRDYDAKELLLRYGRVRQLRRFPGGDVRRVFVLSRVTLGADVAVTSMALAAAKQRFPEAEILLVGPEKNAEMFADDPRITPIAVMYGRSSLLRERLAAAAELQVAVDEQGAIVIDPDSRLTQLGLIPICDDSRYFFFESRGFGGELNASLSTLTSEWLREVFNIESVEPYVAPPKQKSFAEITVSLGVGENPDKLVGDHFEQVVVSALLQFARPILLDRGPGGEETARVDRLVDRLRAPPLLNLHDGSYASFASHILQSRLYVGYDSAGQHVAAACHLPLVSVFAGYACERMLSRWRPSGSTSHVIAVSDRTDSTVLDQTLGAIAEAAEEAWVISKGRMSTST
ncbi:MAG: glycosyltransferase family 9 protein [Acidobacteriaceae bacterium]|nr:glycosyltransferase family 9 protein [Acidobacteriaceae bacterium]MBV9781976.1 glycosyltransferase family 9 protein [Acidobacteriaceae bacterium]